MSRVRGVENSTTIVRRALGTLTLTQSHRHWQAIMENCPPYNPARRRPSLMHSSHSSKSSPAKRDATRILTPQSNSNHAVPPTDDAFNTGLLTPQASQNTFDSDAATSLISPPPEHSARAGINRQSVRVGPATCLFFSTNRSILENQSSWTRAGSEPAADLLHVANTGSSSKRKRPTLPSLSLPDSGGPSQLQRMAEASPNPKPRKQTRRSRVGSGVGEFIFFLDLLIGSSIIMPDHVRGRCPEQRSSLRKRLSGCKEAAPESCSPTREY
jgi:hypothetical protein